MIRLRDLTDRKLVQWFAAYLAGAWALVQVADVVGARFDVPTLWVRMLIVLLGVGAVAVLVLAWYHGEQGAQSVGTVELAMLTALLVIAGAAVVWVLPAASARSDSSAVPPPGDSTRDASIAVLPFVNLSDSRENEYFADGITEEILSSLGRSHQLRVISRTSVMQYRDSKKPLRQIAAELGVGAILEGSVRRYGSQVRITAQLIDARTDEHLWSENYDRAVDDVFAIQTDIAQHIADALQVTLTQVDGSAATAGRTENLGAYDLYLKGITTAERVDSQSLFAAVSLFREALQIDSTYALVYTGLADAFAMINQEGHAVGPAWLDSAYAAAGKALALAPQMAEAHATLGAIHWYAGRMSDADQEYRAAAAMDPNNSNALRGLALTSFEDGVEESFRWALRAHRVDPFDVIALNLIGRVYLVVGDFQNAERRFRKSVAIEPESGNHLGHQMLVYTLLAQELLDAADAALAEYRIATPDFSLRTRAHIALLRGQHTDATRLYEELHRAAREDDAASAPPVELAYLYLRAGERNKAERALRALEAEAVKSVELGNNPYAHTTLAEVCAIRGDTSCALRHLELGIREHYTRSGLGTSPTLDNLRGIPEFERILARIDARGAAMRERLARIAS